MTLAGRWLLGLVSPSIGRLLLPRLSDPRCSRLASMCGQPNPSAPVRRWLWRARQRWAFVRLVEKQRSRVRSPVRDEARAPSPTATACRGTDSPRHARSAMTAWSVWQPRQAPSGRASARGVNERASVHLTPQLGPASVHFIAAVGTPHFHPAGRVESSRALTVRLRSGWSVPSQLMVFTDGVWGVLLGVRSSECAAPVPRSVLPGS
jgi:hypothetical protein